MTSKILVVDDEAPIRELLQRALVSEGFQVTTASGGRQALERLSSDRPELLVLDFNLPDASGESIYTRIRRDPATQSLPIIIVTGGDPEELEARCLIGGADAFLAKPFKEEVLIAHVKALLRRSASYLASDTLLQRGPLAIDVRARRVLYGTHECPPFTPKEFDLLLKIVAQSPQVVSKDALAAGVWGVPLAQLHPRTLDVHIRRIRAKLGDDAGTSLKTVPAVGYQWDPAINR